LIYVQQLEVKHDDQKIDRRGDSDL
jgi:hypothetical protein